MNINQLSTEQLIGMSRSFRNEADIYKSRDKSSLKLITELEERLQFYENMWNGTTYICSYIQQHLIWNRNLQPHLVFQSQVISPTRETPNIWKKEILLILKKPDFSLISLAFFNLCALQSTDCGFFNMELIISSLGRIQLL